MPPLSALRRLQVCSVNRFGHVISAGISPAILRPFAEACDAEVIACLEVIQEHEVGAHSTHALTVGAGGASVHCVVKHGSGSNLDT
jgi:hypothetical protein